MEMLCYANVGSSQAFRRRYLAFIALIVATFSSLPTAAQDRYTVNSDGVRILVKTPTCKNAQYTKLEEWGGDFFNAWCLDRDRLTRSFVTNRGLALNGIYEKVVDKVVFWRGVEGKQCTSGHKTFIELFNQFHTFYGKRPELLYRDLDEGVREFLATEDSCRGQGIPPVAQPSPDASGRQIAPARAAENTQAGEPTEEDKLLANGVVRAALADAVSKASSLRPGFENAEQRLVYLRWLGKASERLERYVSDHRERIGLLETVWYESRRAGLEPELVLGLIEVSSSFRKYAISAAGARGYMQVMPFWARLIGDGDPAVLFHTQTNLRFGCTILRHYLDLERGDLSMALGRYNGTRGNSEFPGRVLGAGRDWDSGIQ